MMSSRIWVAVCPTVLTKPACCAFCPHCPHCCDRTGRAASNKAAKTVNTLLRVIEPPSQIPGGKARESANIGSKDELGATLRPPLKAVKRSRIWDIGADKEQKEPEL